MMTTMTMAGPRTTEGTRPPSSERRRQRERAVGDDEAPRVARRKDRSHVALATVPRAEVHIHPGLLTVRPPHQGAGPAPLMRRGCPPPHAPGNRGVGAAPVECPEEHVGETIQVLMEVRAAAWPEATGGRGMPVVPAHRAPQLRGHAEKAKRRASHLDDDCAGLRTNDVAHVAPVRGHHPSSVEKEPALIHPRHTAKVAY
mmetsp:Transcript_105174/g.327903  ORF Transcript_105174/g.327903 Transcript_105174/m.327903 type:complete len:200 (+) Transcript_105174:130-729(+)